MTDIEKKAYEAYPKFGDDAKDLAMGQVRERNGYIAACKEYESLPKIHGWVARDKNGELNLFPGEPYRAEGRYLRCWYNDGGFCRIDSKLFPEITWKSEPVEVELLIRKVESTKQV